MTMNITNELRKYALGWDERNRVRRDLEHIADRIDEALEGYIELPKDADGQTIRLGDMMEFTDGSVDEDEVNMFAVGGYNSELPEGRGRLLVADDDGNNWYPDQLRHVQPDSWERIIEDAAKNIYPNGAFNPCWDKVRDELVERCKRLAGEDA